MIMESNPVSAAKQLAQKAGDLATEAEEASSIAEDQLRRVREDTIFLPSGPTYSYYARRARNCVERADRATHGILTIFDQLDELLKALLSQSPPNASDIGEVLNAKNDAEEAQTRAMTAARAAEVAATKLEIYDTYELVRREPVTASQPPSGGPIRRTGTQSRSDPQPEETPIVVRRITETTGEERVRVDPKVDPYSIRNLIRRWVWRRPVEA